MFNNNNKQLLDENEHDIKNYPDLGQCYPPQPSADNINLGLDNKAIMWLLEGVMWPDKSRVIIIITNIEGQKITKGTINLVKDAIH